MLKNIAPKVKILRNTTLKNIMALGMVAVMAASCAQQGQGGFGGQGGGFGANTGNGIGGSGINKSMIGGLAGAVGG